MTRVAVSIVTWNSAKVLVHCLESLKRQTFQDFSLLVTDNASADASRSLVRTFFPAASILQNPRNLGFGRGHNQAFHLTQAPLVLCLNPDTVLEPDALERLISVLENDSAVAVVGPKLLRYYLTDDELTPIVKTALIDSTGIERRRTNAFHERGGNTRDRGQFDHASDVFAVSGACCLFRRQALKDIEFIHEFFDESFFAYKEDIDLCWRLRHRGWRIRFEPAAVVYHRRGFRSPDQPDNPATQARERRQQPQRLRTLSYRNHLLTIIKNQPVREFLRGFLWQVGYELGKFFYLLVTEPSTLAGLTSAMTLLPRCLHKRRFILKHRHTAPWTSPSSS